MTEPLEPEVDEDLVDDEESDEGAGPVPTTRAVETGTAAPGERRSLTVKPRQK